MALQEVSCRFPCHVDNLWLAPSCCCQGVGVRLLCAKVIQANGGSYGLGVIAWQEWFLNTGPEAPLTLKTELHAKTTPFMRTSLRGALLLVM